MPRNSARRARVAYGELARAASDYARALVPTVGEEHMRPGDFITQVRRLRVYAAELVHVSVILERARGTTWDVIAARLHRDTESVVAEYGPVFERWRHGEAAPWRPRVEGVEPACMPPEPSDDVDAAEQSLREWVGP